MLKKGDVRLGYADSKTGKLQIQTYYEKQRLAGAYLTLLNELRRAKTEYRLNDWLFYQLTTRAVEKTGAGKTKQHRVFMRWLLLNLAGFDCRLTYEGNRVYLNLFTYDNLYEIPMIQDGGKTFVNVSENEYPSSRAESLYITDYVPNPGGRAFDFSMHELPLLPARPTRKRLEFQANFETYELEFFYDKTLTDIMRDYPYLADDEYFAVPMSPALRESLLPALRELLADKTQQEALSILAGLTRSGFGYKLDEQQFGKSRPMIAEELFLYPYSDCEDRCALFYNLAKELVGTPMIVLAFDDHVSIAVSSEMEGDRIIWEGKNYYVADPTGPTNSSHIGYFPRGYRERDFEVIAEFLGK